MAAGMMRRHSGRATPKASRLGLPDELWARWRAVRLDPAVFGADPALSDTTRTLVDEATWAGGSCVDEGALGEAERGLARLGATAAVDALGDVPAFPDGLDSAVAVAMVGRLLRTHRPQRLVAATSSGPEWTHAAFGVAQAEAKRIGGHDDQPAAGPTGPGGSGGRRRPPWLDDAMVLVFDLHAGAAAVAYLHAVVLTEHRRRTSTERAVLARARADEAEAERRAKRAERRRQRRQWVAPAPSTPRPLVDPKALARAEADRQRLAEAFAAVFQSGADRAEALRHYRQVAVEVGDVDGATWAKQELRTLRMQANETDREAQTTGPDTGHHTKGQ